MSFPSNPQPSSNPHSTTARVGHLLPEFSFNLWDHFHQDISSSTPTTTLHPYPISHLDQLSNTNTLDFPSNLPSLWAYQTLLGFTPNQFNPYSTYPPLQSTTTLYTHLNQPPSTLPPPNQTLSSSNPSIPYHPLPSPITPLPHQNIGDDPPNRSSPASSFKMFKCTLDPNCEMEFTRAEHLARHERKHTKEKPFKCHCTKSFSRLDNWRQHKLSVHKEDAQQNALTEERLVQVHKSMQRQNNIRKAATMASQNHDRFQRCPSITGSSESTTYSPAPSSFSDPSLAPHPSYPPHSHPLSPLPTQTPDRTLSNPFTNPLGIIPNSNPSLLIPLTTPINTPAQHKPNSEQTTDHFSRQYSPRLINYNQISRAPLSSLWPIFQQQQQPSSSSSSSTSTTSSSHYPNSPCQSNFRHQTSAPITQSSDQAAAGLLFKMNDQLVSHHLQFLSSLTHEQTTTLTPRKAAPGILRNGDLGYVENQRAYASYLLVGQNTPDSGSRKRPLATDDGLEAGSNGQANEPNFVKKIRI